MRRRALPLLVLAALLAFPAGALANAYTRVQAVYTASGTGQIPTCEFSSAVLEAALKQAPSYNYQYQSDFTDAIQAALAGRANGDCAGTTTPATSSLGSGAHLSSGAGALPDSLTGPGSGGLPLVLVVVFALIGAVLVTVAGWFVLSALGYEPRVLRAARHSLREAEYRVAAGWDDLADRLRR